MTGSPEPMFIYTQTMTLQNANIWTIRHCTSRQSRRTTGVEFFLACKHSNLLQTSVFKQPPLHKVRSSRSLRSNGDKMMIYAWHDLELVGTHGNTDTEILVRTASIICGNRDSCEINIASKFSE